MSRRVSQAMAALRARMAVESPDSPTPSAPASPAEQAQAVESAAADAAVHADDADTPREHYVEPDNPLPHVQLADLPAHLGGAVRAAGWKQLNPVQSLAYNYVIKGRDLMIQSRTGSGKTGAFVLPLLERIDPKRPAVQGLVLLPTRELALQVAREAEMLAKGSGIGVKTVAVYGGVAYGPQLDALRQGAHLVVGTPGRILDHLMRGSMRLDALNTLIFDEADHMLSMGFYPDMLQLRRYLPGGQAAFMFSATFPSSVMNLSKQFMRDPGFMSLSHDSVHVSGTEHMFYTGAAMDRDRMLVRVIETENPERALIFCNTKVRVNYVATILRRFGYSADLLTSDLGQNDRERVLRKVHERKLRFLVATDVAARGIDIRGLSHVIQFEVPGDQETYIHRAGRTGRAGAAGTAITLVDAVDRSKLKAIGRRFDIDFEEREAPSDADVEAIVAQRLTARLEARLRGCDQVQRERMTRFVPLARFLAESDEGATVLSFLLDEQYLALQASDQATLMEALPGAGAPVAAEAPAPQPVGGAGRGDRGEGSEREGREGRGGRRRGGRGRDRDRDEARPADGGRKSEPTATAAHDARPASAAVTAPKKSAEQKPAAKPIAKTPARPSAKASTTVPSTRSSGVSRGGRSTAPDAAPKATAKSSSKTAPVSTRSSKAASAAKPAAAGEPAKRTSRAPVKAGAETKSTRRPATSSRVRSAAAAARAAAAAVEAEPVLRSARSASAKAAPSKAPARKPAAKPAAKTTTRAATSSSARPAAGRGTAKSASSGKSTTSTAAPARRKATSSRTKK